MHAIFFQTCSPFVGNNILRVAQGFLKHDYLHKDLSRTYITLVLKKETLQNVSDYQPLVFAIHLVKLYLNFLLIGYK